MVILAGSAIWFFAFEERNNEIVGVTSIMPKEFILNGQTIRAGIVGDIMVSSRYRDLGIGLRLQENLIKLMPDFDLKFLYVIPNNNSRKIIQRAGFINIDIFHSLVKPIKLSYYLEQYMNSRLVKILSPFINQGLKILSKETFISTNGRFEEPYKTDEFFDILWKKAIKNQSCLLGDHSSKYLRWRYFQNPVDKCYVLTYKRSQGEEMLGYIIYIIKHEKITINFIIALSPSVIMKLLKKLIQIAKEKECKGVYVNLCRRNPSFKCFKAFNFFNTKDELEVFFCGDPKILHNGWHFFNSDRNI